jgi:hypothetical protein
MALNFFPGGKAPQTLRMTTDPIAFTYAYGHRGLKSLADLFFFYNDMMLS